MMSMWVKNHRRDARRVAAGLLLATAALGAQAEVWKCRAEDGSTRFSDRPCPGSGQPMDPRQLQGNVIDALRVQPSAEAAPEAGNRAPVNDCPGDQELRDMEVRANSRSLGDAEKSFMQDEIRRVFQCRKGQGRYTMDDWKISREARAAQSSSNAENARRRAEAMHSAADPVEGDRIAQQRLEAERQGQIAAAARQRRLAQQPKPPCPAGSSVAPQGGCH
ncbi:DUF4124 domain-containing protein [Roseateles sp. DAIF2]|uniref:DUF4124 domain-containing protein n=1 Tax=Roseateles sp. DAIF2 TaxID=2714952 RepID=UPI0018A32214|nr:DUF4124 domain-containing protein [Roseateles sp. DAIF2]QPF72782.1 DUF4124 domain-containing protein [Roseateles sp. DAIF2]